MNIQSIIKSININSYYWIISAISIRTDGVIFLTQWVHPVPSADKGIILSCTVIIRVQAMRGVKLLTVVFVVLLVWVMCGAILCTVRECQLQNKRNNKGNSIHIEEKSQQHRFDNVTGFLCFYYAPLEQKSQRIIRIIFGVCRLRNISGSQSLRLSKRFLMDFYPSGQINLLLSSLFLSRIIEMPE